MKCSLGSVGYIISLGMVGLVFLTGASAALSINFFVLVFIS